MPGFISNPNVKSIIEPVQSNLNSSVDLLLANETFIGTGEDVSAFVSIDVSVLSDKISAVNGLLFEWSQDNITYGYSESFTVQPNTGQFLSLTPRSKYFRVSYTNGLTDQTNFSLSTTFYTVSRSNHIQNLNTDIPSEKAAEIVKTVLAAQKYGAKDNPYINLQATTSGYLKVSVDTAIFPATNTASIRQKKSLSPTLDQDFYATFNSNTILGNTIFAVVMQCQGTYGSTYTLSDTQSNLYSKTGSVNIIGVGTIDLWYANSAGGPCTVAAINFNNPTIVALQIYEVSGLLISGNILDKITASFSTGTSFSVGPVVTNQSGEFCLTAYVADGYSTISPGAGWSSDLSNFSVGCFSQVQNTAGSLLGTATTTSTVNCLSVIATFLPNVTSKPILTDPTGKIITKSQLEFDDGYAISAGQKTMANSLPVVIASDQSLAISDNGGSLTVDGTVTANIGNWLGSAAPTIGQKTSSNSLPIVLASDQVIPVSGSTPDGAVPTTHPIIVSGIDGSNVRTLLTDTSGRLLIKITDGTDILDLDSSGRISLQTDGIDGNSVPSKVLQIGGKDNSNDLRAIAVDNVGRIITAPQSSISTFAGFAAGHITTAATTLVSVRNTAYIEQTTNAQRSINSSSASDTSAGTGARTVKITYYDSVGAGPNTETISLSGTSFVNTVNTNICFIEKIEVLTVGSGGVNAGIITLKAATAGGGATIGTIATSENRTFWGHHYTPTGKITNITGISVSHNGTTVGSGGLFTIRSIPIGVSNSVEILISDEVRLYGQSSTFSRNYGTPIKITGPARTTLYIAPETSTSTVYRGAFDYYDQ